VFGRIDLAFVDGKQGFFNVFLSVLPLIVNEDFCDTSGLQLVEGNLYNSCFCPSSLSRL